MVSVVVVLRLYYINTLKRELVDTNAYKLQPSLSERVVDDGHGCHTALYFGVKAKENQDKVPTLYCLPKLHKNPINQDLLLILVLVRPRNCPKLLTSCLSNVINRGSYMSAHVLLNLLNDLWKRDKMQGLPSILSLFRNEFN